MQSNPCKEERQVSREEAIAFARSKEMVFIETSAKIGANVKSLFRKLATALPGADGPRNEAEKADMIDIKLAPAEDDNLGGVDGSSAQTASSCGC